jgi:5'-nucleotidase (lipoprotein e(P4) family)
MRHRLAFVVVFAALSAACSHNPPQTIYSGASDSAKFGADDRLNATLWTQSAIEHDLVFREIYHTAQTKLLLALADPSWDALPKGERTGDAKGLPPAVIVDVDETVLDNSPFDVRMIRDNSVMNEAAWTAWVEQKSARALPGAAEFAKFAASHGVTMFYVTNRADNLVAVTRENLQAQGFPIATNEETVLGKGANTPGCIAQGSDKGCRRKLIAEHHRILLMVGDQLGDFVDGADDDPTARAQLAHQYVDWFGERWFALPNPTYGSWETAVTHHAATAKLRSDPRAAKHAVLHEN